MPIADTPPSGAGELRACYVFFAQPLMQRHIRSDREAHSEGPIGKQLET